MRLQLALAALAGLAPAIAHADDRAEVSTSLFVESREGGKGGLTVVHPQALFGIDIGRYTSLDFAYDADAVSGATATIYQADAVSTATTFSDFRNEGTVTFGLHGKRSRLSISGTFGVERDYISRQVGGNASIDLPGRNTTVALAFTHGFDQVCDRDNSANTPLDSKALVGDDPCDTKIFYGVDHLDPMTMAVRTTWKDLTIDTAQATLTQNLSPTMNMQLSVFGQILNGFQSNPYRRVRVNQNSPQEHIPDVRDRLAVEARLNRYLPSLKSAVHFDARFYDDTWGVLGGNFELAYSQYIGKSMLLRVFARLYQQRAAAFFKDAFYYETESSAGTYWTGDRELSAVRNEVVGGKLTLITIAGDKPVWGLFDKLNFNVKGDLLILDQLPADPSLSNPMGIDKQFLYGTGLLDAVILQLGLLGTY